MKPQVQGTSVLSLMCFLLYFAGLEVAIWLLSTVSRGENSRKGKLCVSLQSHVLSPQTWRHWWNLLLTRALRWSLYITIPDTSLSFFHTKKQKLNRKIRKKRGRRAVYSCSSLMAVCLHEGVSGRAPIERQRCNKTWYDLYFLIKACLVGECLLTPIRAGNYHELLPKPGES